MPAELPLPTPFRDLLNSRSAEEGEGVDGQTWLASLPGRVENHLDQWDLTPDGETSWGYNSLVLPVRRRHEKLALKITWPHSGARHEHLALRAWRGVGAVRLVAADPTNWALLLERCAPDDELRTMSALDAAEIIGRIHVRLRHPALPQVDTASAWCTRLGRRLAETPPMLPRRMLQHGITLTQDLADPSRDTTLVHSDLHYDNVMRADRANTVEHHVAIDPKPLNGDPALAIAPLLWNRWAETEAAYNLRNHLRFRVDYACDPMGVDPARARSWSILRLVDFACDATDADRRNGSRTPPDLTRTIAIIKAMQG